MEHSFARAEVRMLRVSPYKLNDVVKPIRGKNALAALSILKGMKKRIAVDVFKAVSSAIANAENNHGLDVDGLHVYEASVGKDRVALRRPDYKGRSRTGRIVKQFSRMRIVLRTS